MASMLPAAIYGLRVPAGEGPIPAAIDFPATFRITMAAIDPVADAQSGDGQKAPRSTLKLIRERADIDDDDDDEDEDDEDYDDDDIEAIKARLAGIISDEDSELSEDDDVSGDEKNGGPSDPVKSKKAKQAALSKKLQEEQDAEDMEIDQMSNGIALKGKGKMTDGDLGSDFDEDEDSDEDEVEEFVLCTLDPEKHYQQPLDITVGEHEAVYFSATGAFDIFITGNYVLPPDGFRSEDEEDDYDSDELDYDLSPDEDELDVLDELEEVSDSEEDALDALENPRVTEIDSDDEKDAPKLVASGKKATKKRPAESSEDDDVDEGDTLDKLISKTLKAESPAMNGDEKLSKKQAKKLKKNDGQAAAAAQAPAKKEKAEAPGSDKKKVQFAKNLEQGPSGSPKVEEAKKEVPKVRVVQGVTVEDKKEGKGRAAKKGDKIEMRYIGKLTNGKQFDANKKGKPFSFKLGVGEVIKGWDVGVVGMTAGGERRLKIPAKLAYGNKPLPDIPANSDLVFDIKCLAVN